MLITFSIWMLLWFLTLAFLWVYKRRTKVKVFTWLPEVANRNPSSLEKIYEPTILVMGLLLITFVLCKEIARDHAANEKTALFLVAGEKFQENSGHFLQQQSLLKGMVSDIQRLGLDFELGFLLGGKENSFYCPLTKDFGYLEFYLNNPASLHNVQSNPDTLLKTTCDLYAPSSSELHICFVFSSIEVASQLIEGYSWAWDLAGVRKTLIILGKEGPLKSMRDTEVVFLDGKLPPNEDVMRFSKIPVGVRSKKWIYPSHIEHLLSGFGLLLVFLSGLRFSSINIRIGRVGQNKIAGARIVVLILVFTAMGADSLAENKKGNITSSNLVIGEEFKNSPPLKNYRIFETKPDLSKAFYHERLALDSSGVNKEFHLSKAAEIYTFASEEDGETGLQGLIGLVRVFGFGSHSFSPRVFLDLDNRLKERISKTSDLKQKESLQKSLAYLWFYRDLKAWKASEAIYGEKDADGQYAETENAKTGKGESKKAIDKTLPKKGQDGAGVPRDNSPGAGNMDLAKWQGEVKNLGPSQSKDFIESAAFKILSRKR